MAVAEEHALEMWSPLFHIREIVGEMSTYGQLKKLLLEEKQAPDYATIARFIFLHFAQCSPKYWLRYRNFYIPLGGIQVSLGEIPVSFRNSL